MLGEILSAASCDVRSTLWQVTKMLTADGGSHSILDMAFTRMHECHLCKLEACAQPPQQALSRQQAS